MQDQKLQVVDRIKQANNILLTVKSDPTVDHLAACLGLTLALNKLGKHATAVFSGAIPPAIEFLQPERTIEKNTDSLRDFIIALDKSKADKLRYKVEDRVVKIFITPYKTSISDKDLEFSQGDFNVDVVLALGVHEQRDLDQAITAHGRILHDATVMSVNVLAGPALGSINWIDTSASSLSELAVELVDGLDKKLLDGQIATSFLTGIVAETARFSNEKTSPRTMSISAELMAVGANQQLVATKLEEPAPVVEAAPTPDATVEGDASTPAEPPKPNDGSLEIDHTHDASAEPAQSEPEEPEEAEPEPEPPQIHIDDEGALRLPDTPDEEHEHDNNGHMILQPPTLGGQLTANSTPEGLEPATDPLSLPQIEPPILNREPIGTTPPPKEERHEAGPIVVEPPKYDDTPPPVDNAAPAATAPASAMSAQTGEDETLTEIERQLHSPHVDEENTPPPTEDSARKAVETAIDSDPNQRPEPKAALNTTQLGGDLHPADQQPPLENAASPAVAPGTNPAPPVVYDPMSTTVPASPAPFAPPGLTLPSTDQAAAQSPALPPTENADNAQKADPNAPPEVPPPLMPNMGQ
jgi:hypothetical protein